MKVTSLYIPIMIASLQMLASPGSGQGLEDIKVTVELKNAKLETLFTSIHDQTGLLFTFFPEQVDAYTGITLAKATRSVKATLDMVLGNTPLMYKQVNNNIVILTPTASGEEKSGAVPIIEKVQRGALATVTGTVTDSKTSMAMAGVNVIVKGTTKGTSTDKDGKFAIDVEDKDVLVFSFIGFRTFETQVSARSVIEVMMEEDVNALQEVVVNAGYWNVREKERTGSISKVTAEEIQKQPVSNPLQALQGRVPGIYINQETGVPGGNFTVKIRGQNSIVNGNDPLYIVDGVPFSSETLSSTQTSVNIYQSFGASPLNSINPDDIESIEILKDADATAIYGSRGANGVVLITTKKGKIGKTSLDINLYKGASKVGRMMDLLNTQQYLEMREEAYANDNITTYPTNAYDINGSWDPNRYTNWQKVLIGGTAQTTNLKATISSGSANTQFLFSGGYQKQGTVFPGDFYIDKISSHLSLVHTSFDEKIKITFSTNYVVNRNNFLSKDLTSTSVTLAPNAPPLYDENGNLNWENSTWNNPLQELGRKYKAITNNLVSNAVLGYEVLKGLNAKVSLGFNDMQLIDKKITPSTYYSPSLNLTPANGADIYLNSSKRQSWIIEPQVDWQNKIGGGQLLVMTGVTFQTKLTEQFVHYGSGFSSNALIEDISAASTNDVVSDDNTIYRYSAFFGRINYNWQGKYIFNLTGRRDGSSRFGPGKQFANFGALGFAWVFSNEKLIKNNLTFLSYGKLRASYGVTGNDQIGDYKYLDTFGTAGTYGGVVGLSTIRLYNPDFAWEVNKKMEAAFEFGFIDDRILLTTSYYRNRSSNQLVDYPLARTTGFTGVQSNLPATVQNDGIEMELSTTNLKRGLLKWTTSVNVTIPKNKLIKFPNLEFSSYANKYMVGEPLNISKVYHNLGVNPETGVYEIEDMSGDGVLSTADRMLVVRTGQEYYGGLNNSFTFKGLQLDILFQFVKQSGANYWGSYSIPPGLANTNQPVDVLAHRWKEPGDDVIAQRFTVNNPAALLASSRYRFSQSTIIDASFIRLKNVALSYQFPAIGTTGVKCRLYLQGQNLFAITNYFGLDPESGSVSLPILKTFSMGAELIF